MVKKTAKRVKHVPQRTCVGCRETLPKRSMIRVVRASEGVHVDPSGKAAGRGAYLHDRRLCWERGMKGALAHALKVELSNQDRENLRVFMQTLPEDSTDQTAATISAEAETISAAAEPESMDEKQDHGPTEQDKKPAGSLGKRNMNR